MRRHNSAGTSRGSRRPSRPWKRSSPVRRPPTPSRPSPRSGMGAGTKGLKPIGQRRTARRTRMPRPSSAPRALSTRTPPVRRSHGLDRRVLVLAGEVDLNSPARAMAEFAELFAGRAGHSAQGRPLPVARRRRPVRGEHRGVPGVAGGRRHGACTGPSPEVLPAIPRSMITRLAPGRVPAEQRAGTARSSRCSGRNQTSSSPPSPSSARRYRPSSNTVSTTTTITPWATTYSIRIPGATCAFRLSSCVPIDAVAL